MNQLKRGLGYVWIILGPAVMIFMFWQALDKVGLARLQAANAAEGPAKELANSIAVNTMLQWFIIIAVFVPVACGMVIFGRYATQGAYDHLPATSEEL